MDAGNVLASARLVPVVVVERPDAGVELARTFGEAGLGFIEVTLRTEAAIEAIARIGAEVPDVCVGAGSVRTPEQLGAVAEVGARFAVCPGSTDALLDAAAERDMPLVPGATTSTEILRLLDRGYQLQKFFPAELSGGMSMLEALGAPIPDVRFFPTGGITEEMAPRYLSLDNVACVGGTWVAPRDLLGQGDFEAIGRLARSAAAL